MSKIGFVLFSICISMNLFADVKISNLRDINLGTWVGQGDLRSSTSLCITNIPAGLYRITAFGEGRRNRFDIFNGSERLRYQVQFNDGRRFRRMRPSRPIIRRRNASDIEDCPNGLNAQIRVRIRERRLFAATPGRYQGVLTLLLAPE